MIEMTERLERALEALTAYYDSWVVYPDLVTEVIAAYREARDAPKTGRLEVGQRVYRRSGRSGLVKEHRLGVLPDDGPADGYLETWLSADVQAAPSEEQGHTIDFQNALGETVPVTLPECFAGADKVVSGKSLWAAEPDDVRSRPDLEPITVADEGVRVEPRYETPLTTERLVRVLRKLYAEHKQPGSDLRTLTVSEVGGMIAGWLADALEAEEE